MATTDSKSTPTHISRELAVELYARMALIKRFEEVAYRAYERGEIDGTIHVSIGQEAVATGVISALKPEDKVLSHHRGHGHALAKGVDPGRLMAELCGRAEGVSRGKGGSMHATDVGCGFLGTLAVVGSSIPLAAGVAMALQRNGGDELCAVFFGDGAINQGVLYESMNLAGLWGLPVLFVCENNAYAISTSANAATAGQGLVARAESFGLNSEAVNGQDVLAVREATERLSAAARDGVPGVLECHTYRLMGHSRGDPPHGLYRSRDEVDGWNARHPLTVLAEAAQIDEETRSVIEKDADSTVQDALGFALSAPDPDPTTLAEDVWG